MKNPNGKFGIIRKALNCSQDQLALYPGVKRGFLSNVERRRPATARRGGIKTARTLQPGIKHPAGHTAGKSVVPATYQQL
jgi:transcriptional regulator with XRE-family HTH domain